MNVEVITKNKTTWMVMWRGDYSRMEWRMFESEREAREMFDDLKRLPEVGATIWEVRE